MIIKINVILAILLGLLTFTTAVTVIKEDGVTNRELDLFITGVILGVIICLVMALIILLL